MKDRSEPETTCGGGVVVEGRKERPLKGSTRIPDECRKARTVSSSPLSYTVRRILLTGAPGNSTGFGQRNKKLVPSNDV